MDRTLAGLAQSWVKKRRRVRDLYNEKNRIKNHILTYEPFLRVPAAELRAVDIRDFVEELSDHRSEQTVRHVLRIVKQTLKDAEERGYVTKNVAAGVSVPKQDRTKDSWTYLTPEEIETLTTSPALTQFERDVVGVAIYTGLRLGELKHLHWEDVVLDGPRPHVVVRYSNGNAAKAGKPGMTDLLPMAIEILSRMRGEARGPLVFPNPRTGQAYGKASCFGWRDSRQKGKFEYPGIKTRAGIERNVRFHDLRHTTAAALISGYWGEPWRMDEVREFMRHSNINVTQRYAHLDPKGLADKVSRMGRRTKTRLGPSSFSYTSKLRVHDTVPLICI